MEETVGSRIRALQRATRVTNEELAAAAGVHVKTVSQWRHDKQRPTDDNLRAIAPLLKTTLAGLLTPLQPATREGTHRERFAVMEAIREGGGYQADAPLTLPSKVHAHAHRIIAELAEEGADEHSLDMARRLLLEPERYSYSVSGRVVLVSEADIIKDMDALASWVREVLRDRRRLKEQGILTDEG